MGPFKFIPKEIKEQILKRIKEEGITVSQAADAGISSKTIYNWMRSKTISDGSILEISRLKRENRELLEIIGELTHDLKKTKKTEEVRMIINKQKRESKTQLAKDLGVSRSSLYYKAKRDNQDEEAREQILIVLGLHPSYGHKRIALEFGLNNKRIYAVL